MTAEVRPAISACLVSYNGKASVLLNLDASAVTDTALLEKCIQDASNGSRHSDEPIPAAQEYPRAEG